MNLASKVVKIDPKIIVSLPKILIPETYCNSKNNSCTGKENEGIS
jgi:hypothetical protein